jgi:hypothetical protein
MPRGALSTSAIQAIVSSPRGQSCLGEAFQGSRRGYLEGRENIRQAMASSGPVLFVRHAGHTEQGAVHSSRIRNTV